MTVELLKRFAPVLLAAVALVPSHLDAQRPFAVLRYETSSLRTLPEDIEMKLRTGKYHSAAVGACEAGGSAGGFTRFRIAILLY